MDNIKKTIGKGIDLLSTLFIFSITVLVLLQILFRFIGFQAMWTSELVRFIFVYLVFIGSALAITEKGHIVIESLVDMFPKKVKRIVYVFAQLLILLFLYWFVRGSLELIESSGDATSISMEWFKVSYLYYGILLGALLMIFYTICEIVDSFTKKHVKNRGEV